MKVKTKKEYKDRRHQRLRKKITGTAERPRLSVFLSNRYIYAQLIDDEAGHTLLSVSTLAGDTGRSPNVTADKAAEVGRLVGERAKELKVTAAVFDRGGFAYGKRLKALADAAREAGLSF
jgi:large subunit ribosomal protein L18